MSGDDVNAILLVSDNIEQLPHQLQGIYLKKILTFPADILQRWKSFKAVNKAALFNMKTHLLSVVEECYSLPQLDFSNANVKIFVDVEPFISYLLIKYPEANYSLLEDGEIIYTEPKKDIAFWLKCLIGYPKTYGRSKSIKSIEVQFPQKLPFRSQKKAVLISYKVMLERLSSVAKQAVLEFYGVEKGFDIAKSKTLILLPQPLSEDGLVSEEYKIGLYNKIIDSYRVDYDIYIKPHPREKTDYTKFEGVNVIRQNFPAELFNLLDIQFTLAISLFSSAVYNFPAEKKIFLGLDYDQKVKIAWLNDVGAKKKH